MERLAETRAFLFGQRPRGRTTPKTSLRRESRRPLVVRGFDGGLYERNLAEGLVLLGQTAALDSSRGWRGRDDDLGAGLAGLQKRVEAEAAR